MSHDASHPLPETIGPYRVVELIGRGGFSHVYKVERFGGGGFRRVFALKVLAPEAEVDADLRAMLADEARIGRHLFHHNIASVHEFGEVRGAYHLVLDWVDGLDLGTLMGRLRADGVSLPLAVILEIGVQMLHGLHHAHTRRGPGETPLGIVHRDLTPGNILVSVDGCVKVADFGLARIRNKIAVTQSGVTRGTSSYMSPEQATGKSIDARSDIFAVGILLYVLCTGSLPFAGDDDTATMMAVARCEFVPLLDRAPDIPPEVAQIVHWMMQRDRERRPLDALAAAELLSARMDSAGGVRPERTLGGLVRGVLGREMPTER
jgi:serine/threonine protein kinase